ncbi:hypothetical protein L596_000634 [Steinernema carpocapsae]|uniref:Uncharacterized protein n=1 Tax=Steinernema carpocapsae TaxID=34508 RepID=A0A4V6I6Y4_STECR|nr:hypothetical protein L596_000634 [Steinernema carpocapsae]
MCEAKRCGRTSVQLCSISIRRFSFEEDTNMDQIPLNFINSTAHQLAKGNAVKLTDLSGHWSSVGDNHREKRVDLFVRIHLSSNVNYVIQTICKDTGKVIRIGELLEHLQALEFARITTLLVQQSDLKEGEQDEELLKKLLRRVPVKRLDIYHCFATEFDHQCSSSCLVEEHKFYYMLNADVVSMQRDSPHELMNYHLYESPHSRKVIVRDVMVYNVA